MSSQITSDNLEITPSMQELANSKLAKLDAHISVTHEDSKFYRIVLNKSSEVDRFEVKLEVKVDGDVYFAEQTDFSLETALIKAVDEVDRQYLKNKDQTSSREQQSVREAKRLDLDEIEPELL